MHIIALLAAAISVHGPLDKVEVPLHRITAAYFMKRSFPALQKGVEGLELEKPKTLTADDEHVYLTPDYSTNKLKLEGPSAKIEILTQYITLLDVKPMKIHFDLTLNDKVMGISNDLSLDCENMNSWTYTNEDLGLTLQGRPRINDDGTVTLFLKAKRDDKGLEVAFRLEKDQPVGINTLEGRKQSITNADLRVGITVKATINEN